MSKPTQKTLTLLGGLQATNLSAARALLGKLRHVDAEWAPKRVSMIEELPGCRSESHLSEALSGDKNFPLLWLPPYVRHDREQLIGNEIAGWTAHKLVPKRPKSTAQRLARLEHVLDTMSDTGDFIRERADALPDEMFADDERGQ